MARSAGVIVLPSEVLKLQMDALPIDDGRPPKLDWRSLDEARPVITGALTPMAGPDADEERRSEPWGATERLGILLMFVTNK